MGLILNSKMNTPSKYYMRFFGSLPPLGIVLFVLSLLAYACTDSLGLEEKVIKTPITKDTLPDTTHHDTVRTKRYIIDSISQYTVETVYQKRGAGTYDTARVAPYPITWINTEKVGTGFVDSINGQYFMTLDLRVKNLNARAVVTNAVEKIQSFAIAVDSLLIAPGPFFKLNTYDNVYARKYSLVEILFENYASVLTRTVSMQFTKMNRNSVTFNLYNERPTRYFYQGMVYPAFQILESTITVYYTYRQ